MAEYYKLLNLAERRYTTHETLEEVHHCILHFVKDMQYAYKLEDYLIRTEHSNYDFHYVMVRDGYEIREFIYFFDTIEEEFDDVVEENCSLNDQIAKLLSERSEWAEEYADRIRSIESEYAIDALQKQINSLQVMNASLKKDLKYKDNCIKEQREHINSLKQQSDAQKKRIDTLTEYNDKLRELNYRLKKAVGQIYGTCLESGEVGDDL